MGKVTNNREIGDQGVDALSDFYHDKQAGLDEFVGIAMLAMLAGAAVYFPRLRIDLYNDNNNKRRINKGGMIAPTTLQKE